MTALMTTANRESLGLRHYWWALDRHQASRQRIVSLRHDIGVYVTPYSAGNSLVELLARILTMHHLRAVTLAH